MYFNPASYFVPEGEYQVLVLVADKQLEIPFTIDVVLMDILAVGKCLISMHVSLRCFMHFYVMGRR